MLLCIFVFYLLTAVVSPYTTPNLKALWNFEEVTECCLHYRAIVYNNYGCWCGIGGGFEPVDEIDRCCMVHDKCYDAAIAEHKCFDVPYEYVDNYSWKCNNSTATCGTNQDACKSALCACDTAVVACWGKHPRPQSKPKCNHTKKRQYSKYFQP